MKKSSLLYKIINGIWDMCYIWKTEMRNVFRDEGVLIFCILVPLGYPLLYSWIYNNEVVREVDTAIVDLSHSHSSREFIRDYDASPDAKATYYCNSLDEAKELVRRQAVFHAEDFPELGSHPVKGFTSCICIIRLHHAGEHLITHCIYARVCEHIHKYIPVVKLECVKGGLLDLLKPLIDGQQM